MRRAKTFFIGNVQERTMAENVQQSAEPRPASETALFGQGMPVKLKVNKLLLYALSKIAFKSGGHRRRRVVKHN